MLYLRKGSEEVWEVSTSACPPLVSGSTRGVKRSSRSSGAHPVYDRGVASKGPGHLSFSLGGWGGGEMPRRKGGVRP